MICGRCLTEILPRFYNTELLRLNCLDVNIALEQLQYISCRICIYGKLIKGKWTAVPRVTDARKNGWKVIEAPDEIAKFYILSQILYNGTESHLDEKNALFALPDENDLVKLLWENGDAIGFYTVKRKETIVFDTMESYEMNTLDTAYIMKQHRGKGYGVSIFQDLVKTFQGEDIAVSTPISDSMYHVLRKFLSINPVYNTKLWEISGVGSEGYRKLIYFSLKKLSLV